MTTKKEIDNIVKKNAPKEGWLFSVFQAEASRPGIGDRIAASSAALQEVIYDLLEAGVDQGLFVWTVYGPHKQPEKNFVSELRRYIS
jgi:hypothetical protein